MENKYYTPDISEFHVGFEYEHLSGSMRMVMLDLKNNMSKDITESKEILTKITFSGNEYDMWRSSFAFKDSLKDNQIRVKYLDKEDIESLGFSNYIPPREYDHTWNIAEFELKVWFNNEIPHIRIKTNFQIIFDGFIKNKSELKRLLEQLGIKNESTEVSTLNNK